MNLAHRCRWTRIGLVLITLVSGPAAGAMAQSLTAGAVRGLVRDEAGNTVPDVDVTLISRATGARIQRQTPRGGEFRFTLVSPGDFDLRLERFGYRPQLIQRLLLRAGDELALNLVLRPVPPTDSLIDTTTYAGAPRGSVQISLHGSTATGDLAEMASPGRRLTGAGWVLSPVSGDLEAQGLPGRFGALGLDGALRFSARHGRLSGAALDGSAFPFAAVGDAGVLAGGTDVEWPGAGGGALAGFSIPGARALSFVFEADAGPDDQGGSFVVSGPIVRDTAHFALGIDIRRLRSAFPAPWGADTSFAASAAAAVAVARDSFQTDLSGYLAEYEESTRIATLFARFDWALAAEHRLALRAAAATVTGEHLSLGPWDAVALGSTLDARDLSLGATLTSTLGTRLGSELRVLVDAGNRDYQDGGPLRTTLVDGGFDAGTSEVLPGLFKRTSVRVSETLHYRTGPLMLKGGLAFDLSSHTSTYADNRAGHAWFADSAGFGQLSGAFRQTVGTTPVARYNSNGTALFVQAMAQVTPALEVAVGIRHESEKLPVAEVRTNAAWRGLTGIDNAALMPARVYAFMPRGSFTWYIGRRRGWIFGAEGGIYSDQADPARLAEVITASSGQNVRRAFGPLGRWPQAPDSTLAPVVGETMSLFGLDYQRPRTGRVAASLTGNIGGAVLRLEGTYRHTDFLTQRRDLNLTVDPSAATGDGRPLYGALAKSGQLVVAMPDGNRRFDAFDAVYSLDPSGFSDYYGFTVGLERPVSRGLSLHAAYTYSKTTDNWFGARAGDAESQLLPFPDSAVVPNWAEGRSDFDVPHRLALGGELRFGGRLGLRIAALYRYRSGYPFTPGYRDGVDVNADGSGRNDPAFISDTIAGAANVIAEHGCLSSSVGRFAERNSCRTPAASALDLRLGMDLFQSGRTKTSVILDGTGVVRSDDDVIDRALYLVDPAAPLAMAGGVTTIPLMANPNFGRPLARRGLGATWRLGIRVSF